MPELCLLTVHAHPDDESSKGAATVARYHAEGVHTVLVSCTGGEAGDILNPAMDRPDVRADLPRVRAEELAAATAIIGYDEVVRLGYRDSGMPGTEANSDPRSFAQAPLDEAVGRLVAVIRRTQPQVIVTYPEDQTGYPHPDHLRVHEITAVAWDAAGDPARFPEAGPAWTPSKLYAVTWSPHRMLAIHETHLARGLESPFSEERVARARAAAAAPPKATTRIDITGYGHIPAEALRAHATQVDPTSAFWFSLPASDAELVWPYEEYERLADRTRATPADGAAAAPAEGEDDLFAGIREPVHR